MSIANWHVPVMRQVCAWYGISTDDLLGSCRKARLVRARHVCAYLLHAEQPNRTHSMIAHKLRLDRATVSYAIKKVARLRQSDQSFNIEVTGLISAIGMEPPGAEPVVYNIDIPAGAVVNINMPQG